MWWRKVTAAYAPSILKLDRMMGVKCSRDYSGRSIMVVEYVYFYLPNHRYLEHNGLGIDVMNFNHDVIAPQAPRTYPQR